MSESTWRVFDTLLIVDVILYGLAVAFGVGKVWSMIQRRYTKNGR